MTLMDILQVRQSKTDTANDVADLFRREGVQSGSAGTAMIGQGGSGLAKEQGKLLSVPTETILSALPVMHRPLDVHVAITLSLLHPFPEGRLFLLRNEEGAELIGLPAISSMTDPVSEMG